jgi:dTDP-glucose 4,6-dehydratase
LRHLLVNTDWEIVCPVTFRHRGLGERLVSSMDGIDDWQERVTVIHHDLTLPFSTMQRHNLRDVDAVLNVASESHVDRSIDDPQGFVRNNVDLVLNLTDFALQIGVRVFLHMSTDEVYGPAPLGHNHVEHEPFRPSNPYSASKAAQEDILFSFWRTYGLPLVVTNTMNIIGEMQDTEKFIPKTIRYLRSGRSMPVHGQKIGDEWVSGSRFYLHARNLADAWLFILRGLDENIELQRYVTGHTVPTKFHVVGEREIANTEIVEMIGDMMGIRAPDRGPDTRWRFVDFHGSRPGHDLRYALDGGKLAAFRWVPPVKFEEALQRTVDWTLAHPEWLR